MNNQINISLSVIMQRSLQCLLVCLLALTSVNAFAIERVTYYHNDALGSPVAATDSNGNLLWREEYQPYGERILREDAGTNDLWYTGKQEEDDFGINYFGARWYDPSIGRFMAIDPVGFTYENLQSFNRYAYANNNPYLYVDPDGKFADIAIEIVSIGAGIISLKRNLNEGNFLSAAIDGGGILVDGALAFLPGVPGGVGLGIKAAREGAEQAGKRLTSKSAGDVAQNIAANKPIVIGENMKDRVIPAAKKQGADYYKPRKTKGDPLKKNERWIDDKMREGRKIIDIGPDPRRSKRSPFYKAEKRRIKKRNYPVTK